MHRPFQSPLLAILGAVVLTLLLSREPLAAQSGSPFFYYFQGSRVPLTLNPGRIAVRFQPGESQASRRTLVDQTGDIQNYDARLDELPLSISLLPVTVGHDPLVAIQKLKQQAKVQAAGRVFQFGDGSQYAETDEFIARFKSDLSPVAITMFNLANGVQLVEAQEYSDRVLILRPLPGNPRSALDLANGYVQSGWVEFAEPNFVIIQPHAPDSPATPALTSSVTPNDPGFSNQWYLQNTGQFYGSLPGADINATAAWGVTTGASSIKIAIIDEGVDASNPDLQGKLLPGINVTITPNNTNTSPNLGNYHGTAVAGIAAAQTNNGLGIAGVCWACQILPVKVAFEDGSGNWVTTISELAGGINWAWYYGGADVLSNSWTMSAPSDDVTTSIVSARSGGRNGYGSTIVFAAGNNNSSTITFPANLNKYVIAVGAANWCDQRKTPTNNDCNDHEGWGSNYGGALDLLAPGQAIYTTSNEPQDLTYFSGTSASTPMVAGVAGLLYSLNPNLQPQDVQSALQFGAKDLPPPGRDNQSGYGRLDAYRAIAALYDVGISLSDNNPLVHPGDAVQYTLTYSNIGMTAMGGTTVKATLPGGLAYTSSSPAFTSLGGGVYQLPTFTLPRYGSGKATINATVQSGTEGKTLTVTAQISGAFPELNLNDNSATDSIGVVASNIFLPMITR